MRQIGSQLLRNILSSWFGYFVRITITFLFVPFLTTVLGDARYGVWVITFQMVTYFTLLDIGLTKALTRFVSKYLARHDFDRINRILSSSTALYAIIGTLVMLGVYLAVTFFFDNFKLSDPALLEEGKTALLILGAYLALSFYFLPYGNSLGSFQRYDLANAINIVEEIVRALLMVAVLIAGHGLIALALVILSTQVAKHLVGIIILKRLHRGIRLSFGRIDAETTRMLLGYSKISFGISIGWIAIYNTDAVLLGLLTSSVAAGVYHPGAQLLHHARNFINAVAIPLMPAISHIEADSDRATVRALYLKGLKYSSYLSFFISAGLIAYARPFIELWLPPEFAEASDVIMILAIGSAFFLPSIIGNAVLYALERHRYLLYVVLIEAVLKIGLALALIGPFGLPGMAIASVVPQLLLYTAVHPIFMGRLLELNPFRLILTSLRYGSYAVLVTVPAAWGMHTIIAPATWTGLFANLAIVGIMILGVGYFILERPDREKLRALYR